MQFAPSGLSLYRVGDLTLTNNADRSVRSGQVLALVQAAMTFVIGSSYRAPDNEAVAALLDHAINALTGWNEKSPLPPNLAE